MSAEHTTMSADRSKAFQVCTTCLLTLAMLSALIIGSFAYL